MNGAPSKERQTTHGLSRRAKWELALGISGLIYVVLTLALSMDSPILSIAFIALAGYDLATSKGPANQ